MRNRYYLRALLVLMLAGTLVCCHVEPNEDCDYGFKTGIVVYAGAPEVDGCGWEILVDSVYYHPVNLDVDYQVNNLTVLLKYVSDPEEFRCGRGGITYPSIRITEIKMNPQEVVVINNDAWDKYSMDPFRLDSVYIKGDFLFMQVGYSGGCSEHEFDLLRLPPNALEPPPIELALSHNANGDACEAYLTRWLVFSLVPIREEGKHEVKFLLRGSPEMSAYFGTFVYKY